MLLGIVSVPVAPVAPLLVARLRNVVALVATIPAVTLARPGFVEDELAV